MWGLVLFLCDGWYGATGYWIEDVLRLRVGFGFFFLGLLCVSAILDDLGNRLGYDSCYGSTNLTMDIRECF